MNDYKIEYVKNPCQADVQVLGDGITENARKRRGMTRLSFSLFFFVMKTTESKVDVMEIFFTDAYGLGNFG